MEKDSHFSIMLHTFHNVSWTHRAYSYPRVCVCASSTPPFPQILVFLILSIIFQHLFPSLSPSLPLSLSFHNIYLYLEPFYFFDRLFNICPLQCNVRFCWTRIIPFVLFLVSPEPKQCPEYNTCSVYISWLFTEWSMFCSCPHVLYICTKVLIIFDYWGGMKSWRSLDMVHRAAPQCPCLHRYLTLINIKMISREKECRQRIS